MAKATAVRVSTGKKFSQLLIITPAVAIDSTEQDDYHGPFNSSSLDSGCGGSSEGSLSDDGLIDENEQQRRRRRRQQSSGGGGGGGVVGDRRNNNGTMGGPLLGGGRRDAGTTTGSWRWCGLICSAVKCFRAAATTTTGSRRSQQGGGASLRQPLAETAVRYTTSEGDDGAAGTRRPGVARFSSNHVYEYTIKSYRQPSREQRRTNGGAGTVTLPVTAAGGGSRSGSISSDSSVLAETDHDHINNNDDDDGDNRAGTSNGNIPSLLQNASGTIALIVTASGCSSGNSSPTIETTARLPDRNAIMYKL